MYFLDLAELNPNTLSTAASSTNLRYLSHGLKEFFGGNQPSCLRPIIRLNPENTNPTTILQVRGPV
jgi:hypothetical protein